LAICRFTNKTQLSSLADGAESESESESLRHVIQKEGRGQEGALTKMLDRQRVWQAAEDAAKNLEDAKGSGGDIEGGGSTGSSRRSTGR
jgi:hypothetical protein